MNNVHDLCSSIVSWAANCPEATVAVWLISAIMMSFQAFSLTKKLVFGKKAPEAVNEIEVPVNVPYVPGDTVLKILKLLQTQENGWEFGYYYHEGVNYNKLSYGKSDFFCVENQVCISYNGVVINLSQRSEDPDLDQHLLKQAYNNRVRVEKNKLRSRQASISRAAEEVASKELSNILDTIS